MLIRMGRFRSLLCGLALYCMGALYARAAGAQVSLSQAVWGYVVLMFGHLSVSYSNDYYDFYADRKGEQTPFSGGSGTLQDYPELRPWALRIALALIAASVVAGTGFVLWYAFSYWYIPAILGGNMIGYFYSALPLSFSYRGWGEVATAISTGIIVPLAGYVCANGQLTYAIAGFVPMAVCYGALFILTVELPDINEDRESGKKTYVVNQGQHAALRAIFVFSVLGTALAIVLHLADSVPMSVNFAVVSLLTMLPLSAAAYGLVRGPGAKEKIVGTVQAVMGALIAYLALLDIYLYAFL